MKLKLANAVLLLLCFFLLAVLSGAIPTLTRADAASSGGPSSDESVFDADAPPDLTAAPSPTPDLTVLSDTPAPTITPAPVSSDGPRLVATTITGDGPLDNDTYYDIDPAEFLSDGADISLPGEGFQVLILHTHTTEAYYGGQYEASDAYRTTDPGCSVVRVGEALAEALSAYGLNVLHDTELHDYPSYTGSYERSGAAVEEYLAAYPGIRLVIDLHRDALGDDDVLYKTLADIDGVEAAQLMFVMGSDVNLDHPDWRDNLRLALTIQAAVAERYPTLMRPTVLCNYRYNQQLSPGCLLLEVGTSGNTLEEALAAVDLFAQAAGPLLASWISD